MSLKSELEFLGSILTDEEYISCKHHIFREDENIDTIDKFARQFLVINKKIVARLIHLAETPEE